MRDFVWLREQLKRALLCAPLAFPIAGCGPTSKPDPVDPPSNETGVDPPVTEVAWPTAEGCGNWGAWCGPVSQAATAAGASASQSCPEAFSHSELYFDLDPDASSQKRSQGEPNTCCYTYNDGCVIGRPLLDRGQAHVASVRDGGAWSRSAVPAMTDAIPIALRDALARGWLDDALLEHASVASFARATLELMAVGAPPDLLADCQRAGLDEVRHAEGCFALVERYQGRRVAPGPLAMLPQRAADLSRLAVDTFVEGCVAETVATLAASRVLAACKDAEVARLLERVVRDETRHAALAWRTVAWAVREGGVAVASAVRVQAEAMAPRPGAAVDDTSDPLLLAHGRLDARTRHQATADAWREIIAPTLADVLVLRT